VPLRIRVLAVSAKDSHHIDMRFCHSLFSLPRHTASRVGFLCCCFLILACTLRAEDKEKDTVTLTSGEHLIGKLVKVVSGTVTFHSDALGVVTIPIAKVKTLHAASFAILAKNQKVTPRTAKDQIPVGTITVENNQITLVPSKAPIAPEPPAPSPVPVKQLQTIVDAKSLQQELQGEHSFLYGWTGSVTLGATIVNATNNSQTYTGAITAVRNIPAVPWTTPVSKTTFDASGTYGLAKDPQIVSSTGAILQYPSVTKTDILHGDAEYDRYASPRFFVLFNSSADHNFGNGLELQQAYGTGVGWSILQYPNNTFDLKLGLQYLEQQFYNGITSGLGTPNENLLGLSSTETWMRTFPRSVKFTESLTLTPTLNVIQASSAVANATLALPVYKKINFSLNSTDNYIGDPAEGYRRNSFQFTAGVTYVVK
jgi:hypothetical protein